MAHGFCSYIPNRNLGKSKIAKASKKFGNVSDELRRLRDQVGALEAC
jgi:hypothetical protein